MFDAIDHLVYAGPNLATAVAHVEKLAGIQATPGGAHPNWGTRNFLIALGPSIYLEIIGPDPDQPEFSGERPFRIDALDKPSLVTWAAKASPLREVVTAAKSAGYDPGRVHDGSRQRPDGSLLEWSLTRPNFEVGEGLVPFLIDWGQSDHPSRAAATGCRLVDFKLAHPKPNDITPCLSAIGCDYEVRQGPTPRIEAAIECPAGRFVLVTG